MLKQTTHQQGKYELHITLLEHVELEGWKSSAIDGDPLLGKGVKHYLTSYSETEEIGRKKIDDALKELDDKPVVRAKIEHIVYDVKIGSPTIEEHQLLSILADAIVGCPTSWEELTKFAESYGLSTKYTKRLRGVFRKYKIDSTSKKMSNNMRLTTTAIILNSLNKDNDIDKTLYKIFDWAYKNHKNVIERKRNECKDWRDR